MKYIDIHTHKFQNKDDIIIELKSYSIDEDLEFIPLKKYTLGVHPWHIRKDGQRQLEKLSEQITRNSIMAIGECGLDFQKKYLENVSQSIQKKVFIEQTYLAEKQNKPVVIHCVKAYDYMLQLKKAFKPKMPWIIHGFSKGHRLAKQLVDAGFYLSFGNLLLKNNSNQMALKFVPLDRIFIETDDKEELDIQQVYACASELLQISTDELKQIIFKNYEAVFGKIKNRQET